MPRFDTGGQEHDVWEADFDPRMYKLTKRNAFGLFPVPDFAAGAMGSRPALPSEYLDRLDLQNVVFGDDNALEGIALSDTGAIYTVTSQPYIKGRAASPSEIARLMIRSGFDLSDEALGAWIRPADRIAILDALPRNVVRDSAGRILPIDLVMGRYFLPNA